MRRTRSGSTGPAERFRVQCDAGGPTCRKKMKDSAVRISERGGRWPDPGEPTASAVGCFGIARETLRTSRFRSQAPAWLPLGQLITKRERSVAPNRLAWTVFIRRLG